MKSTFSFKSALDVTASLALIGAAIFMVVRSSRGPVRPTMPGPKVPEQAVSLSGAPTRGSSSAPIGMVVFSDFQCPFCRALARDVLPTLTSEFIDTGKLLLAFRHIPLPNHPRGRVAAVMSTCAHDAGRFWDVHDRLFLRDNDLSDASLHAAWTAVGLAPAGFAECIASQERDAEMDEAVKDARALQIGSTPTVFIGRMTERGELKATHAISGVKPTTDYVAAINQALGSK